MLWVYGHYKYFYSCSAVIEFIRHMPTSEVGPRAKRVKTIHRQYLNGKQNEKKQIADINNSFGASYGFFEKSYLC